MYSHQPVTGKATTRGPLKAPARTAAARSPGSARSPAGAVLTLQRLAGNSAVRRLIAANQRDSVLTALRAAGRPLSEPVRADLETRLNADLSGVRVHTGAAADRAARAVSAEAFTTGSHLVFRRGSYSPGSAPGRRVLLHELAHFLQQQRGQVAGRGEALKISDPGDRFERAAETTARTAMSRPGRPASARPAQSQAGGQPGRVPSGLPVQRAYLGRHSIKFSPVLFHGSGTEMIAELHPNDPSLSMGSSPSKRPPWWSQIGAASTWFSKYMVQGHLLNDNVGGPGNTMANLTPITKSANSQHHARVEASVKRQVLQNNKVVEYYVQADYSKHPRGQDMAATYAAATPAVINDIDNFTPFMAGKLSAEYTVYDPATGQDLGGDRWEVFNDSL